MCFRWWIGPAILLSAIDKFKRNDPKVIKTFRGQQQKAQYTQTSAPERRLIIQPAELLLGRVENEQVKPLQWTKQGFWGGFCSLTWNSRFWKHFSITSTQNNNKEAQISSQCINISTWFWSLWSLKPYILFSNSIPPAKKLHFFPL